MGIRKYNGPWYTQPSAMYCNSSSLRPIDGSAWQDKFKCPPPDGSVYLNTYYWDPSLPAIRSRENAQTLINDVLKQIIALSLVRK